MNPKFANKTRLETIKLNLIESDISDIRAIRVGYKESKDGSRQPAYLCRVFYDVSNTVRLLEKVVLCSNTQFSQGWHMYVG